MNNQEDRIFRQRSMTTSLPGLSVLVWEILSLNLILSLFWFHNVACATWSATTFNLIFFSGTLCRFRNFLQAIFNMVYWGNISKALHWTSKAFSVCIPVRLWRSTGRKNYPVRLKFATNVDIYEKFYVYVSVCIVQIERVQRYRNVPKNTLRLLRKIL